MELAAWMSGADRLPCPLCREVKSFYKEKPPCETCCPGLHPWNEAAFTVYGLCSGQWRFSFNGAAALDILAVESALRLCSVPPEDWPELTGKVLTIGDVILDEARKQAELSHASSPSRNVH